MSQPPFRDATRAWVRVAAQSFGGPAGQIAVIHRIAVEEKGWVKEDGFLQALGYCMLLPGPEAQQLATYVGWKLHGVRGGLVAGGLFILPGFLSILALSLTYARFGDAPALTALFYGLKPAVLAIVLQAVWRLRTRALRDRPSLLIAGGAFVAMAAFAVPFPLVILSAAVLGALGLDRAEAAPAAAGEAVPPARRRGALAAALVWLVLWLIPVAGLVLVLGGEDVFAREGIFFSQTAVVTFGGAYAVLAYVAQQAVEVYGWLAPAEMLDGLGLAETTPGPLIQVVQFVGFLGAFRNPGALNPYLAGFLGSLVTTWVTFAPCFFFIFAGAPFVEDLTRKPRLRAALAGITAAVVGVILNLAVWFATHTLFGEVDALSAGPMRVLVPVPGSVDLAAMLIAVLAIVAAFGLRWGMFAILAGGAVMGGLMYVA